jgi:DeoR family myo-inositol catabolism operon transcriptional repressor
LSNKEDVTIVTHSLIALYEASKYPNLYIIDLGGVYNHSTASFVGFSTIEVLSRISVKLIFIAATGVSLEHGLTNSTYFEAELKHHLSQRSAQIVLMADHSKFGYSAAVSFLDFSDLDAIVTDSPIPPSFMDAVRKDNIQLLIYNDSK